MEQRGGSGLADGVVMGNFVPFKDERSEAVKAICAKYKPEGCRDVCPLSKPCTMKPNDNFRKFITRMNEAAEALQAPPADDIFKSACALSRSLDWDLLRCA